MPAEVVRNGCPSESDAQGLFGDGGKLRAGHGRRPKSKTGRSPEDCVPKSTLVSDAAPVVAGLLNTVDQRQPGIVHGSKGLPRNHDRACQVAGFASSS